MGRHPLVPSKEWLLSKVFFDTAGGCWLWMGCNGNHGYGTVGVNNEYKLAHRLSWELFFGPIPEKQKVLHKCDVKLCVNPQHLFLGDDQVNFTDMAAKNRGRTGPLPYGVSLLANVTCNPFMARIGFKKKSYYIGVYATIEEAHEAAVALKAKLYNQTEV